MYVFDCFIYMIFIVWLRERSPAAIKSEPEDDNGFYPSPKYNKATKREKDDDEEEYVLFISNKKSLLAAIQNTFSAIL